MSVGQIKLAERLTILQKTLFGWVVAGGVPNQRHSLSLTISVDKSDDNLSSIIQAFWEVENNMSTDPVVTANEEFREQHFSANTERLTTGGYSVRFPQIENLNSSSLGESYQHAFHRFREKVIKISRNKISI